MIKKTPEEVAEDVLRAVGWDGIFPVPSTRIAACYEIKVVRERIFVGGTKICAYILSENGGRYMLINPDEPRSYVNFAVACELGHVFLHKSRSDGDLRGFLREEEEAARFAASLLIPKWRAAEISKTMDIAQMSTYFNVPQRILRVWFGRYGIA